MGPAFNGDFISYVHKHILHDHLCLDSAVDRGSSATHLAGFNPWAHIHKET